MLQGALQKQSHQTNLCSFGRPPMLRIAETQAQVPKRTHGHVLPEYPGWGLDSGSGSKSSVLSVLLHWPLAGKSSSPLSAHQVP